MSAKLMDPFRERMGRVMDVRAAMALLEWDQEVMMPSKGAAARGRQLATLAAIEHGMFTDAAIGESLDALSDAALNEDEAAMIAETRYDYERATCLPESFVEEFAQARSVAYEVWIEAREKKDFQLFKPQLATMVDLSRRKAEMLGYEGSPYNALLDEYERGMTAEKLTTIFEPLAREQSALVKRIAEQGTPIERGWLDQEWDEDTQWSITLSVLGDMGYAFDAGRQDRSVHPFTINMDRQDVRVTTRVDPTNLFSALAGSMHEGGHALYEQGFMQSDERTILAQAPSLGMHESQSLLWENIVGGGMPFWRHYAPLLEKHWGERLGGRGAAELYAAINAVSPSFIRVDADECTYNLHIVLRFEIERGLIEGTVEAGDVPAMWNERVNEYLGLDVPDDALGCLQDVHWSHGLIGYFPTYALGNLYSAQLFEQIQVDLPTLASDIESGNFAPLLGWLREHVHRHGRRKTAGQLIEAVTGRAPESGPYLRYLDEKYSALYGL